MTCWQDTSKPPTKNQTQKVMGKLFQIGDDTNVEDVAELPRKREYHYDGSNLNDGFRDVDAQRAQILNRCVGT